MSKPVLLIAIAGVLAAALVLTSRPMEATMPVYGALAERLREAPVATSFEPLGYSYLIASMPGGSVETQAKRLHFLCYVVLALLTAWHFGHNGRLHPIASAAATIAVLFNPYVLINLFRLNDNNVNVPAILALFIALRNSTLLSASALLGAVTTVRPNAITLFAAVGVAAMGPRLGSVSGRFMTTMLACVGIAAVTFLASAWAMTGRPLFWPTNGPYNLFAGNNPAAMSALVTDYNAETSLPDGLRWCGVEQHLRDVPASTYTACTTRFWREHPIETVRLAGMKFYTMLFRPNLRLADSAFEVALQMGTMILPIAWWTAAAIVVLRRRELIDPLALAFVVLYAAPFVASNADPRFRLPLDGVYALSLASPAVLAKLRGEGRAVSA